MCFLSCRTGQRGQLHSQFSDGLSVRRSARGRPLQQAAHRCERRPFLRLLFETTFFLFFIYLMNKNDRFAMMGSGQT